MFSKPTPEEATIAMEVYFPGNVRMHMRFTPQKYEAIMTLAKEKNLTTYEALQELNIPDIEENRREQFKMKLEAQIKQLMEQTGLSKLEVLEEMKARIDEDQSKKNNG